MFNSLVEIALKRRGWVLSITGLLLISGLHAITQIPIDAVPDITNVQVSINTKTGALDPEKIESRVTRPVETEMGGIPHLEEIRSISKYGLSQVTLVFEDGTDIYWARQQVGERLNNIRKDLPQNTSSELAPITTGLGEVFMYSVEAMPDSPLAKMEEKSRLTALRVIQDYQIRPILKRIAGVAEVDSNGGYQKEIHINFFPDRLEKKGVTLDRLAQHLDTLGENFGGGYIQKNNEQVIVRTIPGFQKLEDLGLIPLGLDVSGHPILLKDVADVREEHSLRVGAATQNGKEIVLGTVLMQSGANSREVAIHSEETLAQLKLPEGIRAVPLYSRSFLVNSTLHTVIKNLAEGAALVVLVLFLLLGNLRAAVIVALAIPLSMIVVARGMLSFGVSASLMSLGAIDFGLLVDGSVVLIENILRKRDSYLSTTGMAVTPEKRRQWILESSQEVIRPIIFGLFMIMLVYVPVLTLGGIEGKMFKPMALTVLMALGASLATAVFVMPVLADLFLPFDTRHATSSRFFEACKARYLKLLNYSFSHKNLFFGSALFLALIALILCTQIGTDFVPRLDEGDLVLTLSRNPRQSIDSSVQSQLEAENQIKSHPEVETVFSRLGTSESATDPMGVYLADTFVILKKDHSLWKAKDKGALAEQLTTELGKLNSDQDISYTQPIEMRFNEILEGSRADVTLRILGPDLNKLLESIGKAKGILESVPGIGSIEFDPLTALKQSPILDVKVNYEALARYGISLSDFNRTVELAMSGQTVGSFFQDALRFPIRLHLDESLRNHFEAIKRIPVSLREGGTLPLSDLAQLKTEDHVTTIARIWGERYAAISMNLKDRDLASFIHEAQEKVSTQLKLSEGYQFYWGGQFKNLHHARAQLYLLIPLLLVAIFLILAKSFRSVKQALLVLSSIPFATLGGVIALYLRNIPLSVSAAIGFIALTGIALLNSIVLITVFHQGEETRDQSLQQTVIRGAVSRLRPVLMTAWVASLGFLPMALNQGIGSEVQRPLATVVIGGLVTSTALTLLLLPLLYLTLIRKPEKHPSGI